MKTKRVPLWQSLGKGLICGMLGALIIAYLVVSVYYSEYSPFLLAHPLLLFLGPLVCGLAIGIILKEFEMATMLYTAIFITVLSVLLVVMVIMGPVLSGLPEYWSEVVVESSVIIYPSVLFILPSTIIGTLLGKMLGEYAFLSEEEKKELKALREETRKWHRMLSKREGKADSGDEIEKKSPKPKGKRA